MRTVHRTVRPLIALIVPLVMLFLGVAPPSAEAQGHCPQPETVAGPQVHARMGSWKQQSKIDVREATYNPPPGCFIRQCKARVLSSFGLTSHSVSMVAAGSSFLTEQEIRQSYDWAFDLAANLAAELGNEKLKADLEAALKEQMEIHLSYAYQIRSTHQACHLYAKATGRGTFVDKGSSIVLGADVELCCGVGELQGRSALRSFLERKVREIQRRHQPILPRWTPWLNRDAPSGTGDYETLRDFVAAGQVCETPKEIQCRVRGTQQVFTRSTTLGREQVVCDLGVGAYCDNRRQEPGVRCSDYEVRFRCS